MTPTDTARCEPPEEWRERDGVHWLQYRDHPMNYADWIAAEQAWFFPHDQVVSPVDSMSTEWRYLAPVTPPATVAALVEALEELVMACDLPGDHCEVEQAMPRALAALALYRGRP